MSEVVVSTEQESLIYVPVESFDTQTPLFSPAPAIYIEGSKCPLELIGAVLDPGDSYKIYHSSSEMAPSPANYLPIYKGLREKLGELIVLYPYEIGNSKTGPNSTRVKNIAIRKAIELSPQFRKNVLRYPARCRIDSIFHLYNIDGESFSIDWMEYHTLVNIEPLIMETSRVLESILKVPNYTQEA
jgi:hypothetical protein